jgi:hypothetical protein
MSRLSPNFEFGQKKNSADAFLNDYRSTKLLLLISTGTFG